MIHLIVQKHVYIFQLENILKKDKVNEKKPCKWNKIKDLYNSYVSYKIRFEQILY